MFNRRIGAVQIISEDGQLKIYTKTGDSGETGLFAGPRVRKDHHRIEAYGEVDELNAAIGRVRSGTLPADVDAVLLQIQHDLFGLGAELATPNPEQSGTALLSDAAVTALELAIDRFEAELPPLTEFILPAGTREAAELHIARTVCRRAERRVVTLANQPKQPVHLRLIRYLNRLSDLLFVLSRAVNHRAGVGDVPWQKPTETANG